MEGKNIILIFIEGAPADTHPVCGLLHGNGLGRVQKTLGLYHLQKYLGDCLLCDYKILAFF